MAATRLRPLPGIRFDQAPIPAGDDLPRMDVPVFVGLAARGPLHTPVPLDDAVAFESVFGGDLPLAWDSERGAMATAHLGRAVRSFFGNGGRRCWVIRVAGAGARANRFQVPGLMKWIGGSLHPVELQASSEGAWSSGMRVGTTLDSRLLRPIPIDAGALEAWDGRDRWFDVDQEILAGELLRISLAGGVDDLYMPVVSAAVTTSLPGPIARIQTRALLVRFGTPVPIPRPDGTGDVGDTVERLRFDVWVTNGQERPLRLGNLGFVPGHPRYWGDLPTDERLYRRWNDGQEPVSPGERWADAVSPRFPLAALGLPDATLAISIPQAMPTSFDPGQLQTATLAGSDDIDGLASYGSALFLDEQLALSTVESLISEADYIRYQATTPRALHGIHAALAIEEATLIAVPDAVHPGWMWETAPAMAADPEPGPNLEPVQARFHQCLDDAIPTPTVVVRSDTHRVRVEWSTPTQEGFRTEVEEIASYIENVPTVVYAGSGTFLEMEGKLAGNYWYRARYIRNGEAGPWSEPELVLVPSGRRLVLNLANDSTIFASMEVQRAMLTMCAARGDLFAVLSLPGHLREAEAVAYVSRLRTGVPTGPPAPERGWSYGAAYHPWVVGAAPDRRGELHASPPDGAICGVIARRANTRGAWIAPANETLGGVVALTPLLPRVAWQELQDAHINVIRHDPRGFLAFSADTLSDDVDLRPIGVRRLLILLRKLAFRRGMTHVFEPYNDAFRRRVQADFTTLLGGLFKRGAFAGETPATSFRVVTDDTVNTLQAIDLGRFVVELRVAPSLPLRFLTVRVVHAADRTLALEEG